MLACTLFSALHGLLGAWVVPAVAPGPVTEICTPSGMQWVAVDADASSYPGGSLPDGPQGLAKPCVWAMAHVAVPPGLGGEGGGDTPLRPVSLGPLPGLGVHHLPGNAARVLLMAPMRAPPA